MLGGLGGGGGVGGESIHNILEDKCSYFFFFFMGQTNQTRNFLYSFLGVNDIELYRLRDFVICMTLPILLFGESVVRALCSHDLHTSPEQTGQL